MDHKDEEIQQQIKDREEKNFYTRLKVITNSPEAEDIIRRIAKNINSSEILAEFNDRMFRDYHGINEVYEEHPAFKSIYDRNCIVVDSIKEMHRDLAKAADILNVEVPAILAVGGTGK